MSWHSREKASCSATGKLSFTAMLRELFGLGCIGFGGGSALIPVFKERLVDTGKVSEEEFENSVAVACITPGALPVELASGIGLKAHGAFGALAAAAVFALPGATLMLLAMMLLNQTTDAALKQISFLAIGVSGYIMSVIFRYIAGTARRASSTRGRAFSCAVIALVFSLTCGKTLLQLIGADVSPVICLGTVEVMGLALFAAIWIGAKKTPGRIVSGIVVILVYCLLNCTFVEANGISKELRLAIVSVMILMAAMSFAQEKRLADSRGCKGRTLFPIKALGSFAAVIGAALAVVGAVSNCGVSFIVNGIISTVLSFGGGDAYIAMADGLFVGNDIVSQSDFYGVIVPISNALPGSILCKVLVGCGYSAGLESTGHTSAALIMGMAGFTIAIAMSCATFAVGNHLLSSLKNLPSFGAVERSVGCVVSGLLLTVSLGLLQTAVTAAPSTASTVFVLGIPLAIAALNLWAKQRFNLSAPIAVAVSAAASMAILNLL